MRTLLTIYCIFLIAIMASCDVRSETAKEGVNKFTSPPTPPILQITTPTPVDPKDIVTVDISLEGDTLNINGYGGKKSEVCTKFNRAMVNGDENVITIKGVCRQIMINGDKNKITADAAMEFVFNGSGNTVSYSRFPNGNHPSVIENRPGNIIEKVSAEAVTSGQPRSKIVK